MNFPLSSVAQEGAQILGMSRSALDMLRCPTPFDQPFTTRPASSSNAIPSTVAFVDGSLNEYQALVAALHPGTEVVILNSAESGLQQVQEYLAGRSNIASLQIFSHGESGGFQLGSDLITTTNANLLQSWASSLTDDADILLYGCNVAQGELGQAFTQILSQVTGADIAASNGLTGSANLGGDWSLEYQVGEIDWSLGAQSSSLQAYNDLLPVFSNTTAITIPGLGTATPYPSTINVSGLGSSITAITVTLTNMSHTFPADVDVLLVGPTGVGVILMSDAGGGTDIVSVTLTFNDAAASEMPAPIVTGTYRPTNTNTGTDDSFPAPAPTGSFTTALSTFTGTNPNGDWQLFIVDDLGGDAGGIAGGWSLDITANAAPVLDISGSPTLPNVPQGTTNPTGITVAELIAQLGGTGITDADVGALQGIAITAVNNSDGNWQYSNDGGANWFDLNTVSSTSALTLASNTMNRIRFVPNAGFSGTVTGGISFRAWDQTSGSNGEADDTSVNGGSSAFSVNVETANVTIDPPPTYNFSTTTYSALEGDTVNTTNVVTVNRTGGTSLASSVDVIVASGSAIAGSDFTAQTVTINFTVGQTTATIPIQIIGDTLNELDETIALSFANPSTGSQIGTSISTATLTIVNDDPAPVVLEPAIIVSSPPAVVIVPTAEVVVTTKPPSIFKPSKKGKQGIKVKVKKQKFRRKK